VKCESTADLDDAATGTDRSRNARNDELGTDECDPSLHGDLSRMLFGRLNGFLRNLFYGLLDTLDDVLTVEVVAVNWILPCIVVGLFGLVDERVEGEELSGLGVVVAVDYVG
jgi:hypothetical protein